MKDKTKVIEVTWELNPNRKIESIVNEFRLEVDESISEDDMQEIEFKNLIKRIILNHALPMEHEDPIVSVNLKVIEEENEWGTKGYVFMGVCKDDDGKFGSMVALENTNIKSGIYVRPKNTDSSDFKFCYLSCDFDVAKKIIESKQINRLLEYEIKNRGYSKSHSPVRVIHNVIMESIIDNTEIKICLMDRTKLQKRLNGNEVEFDKSNFGKYENYMGVA